MAEGNRRLDLQPFGVDCSNHIATGEACGDCSHSANLPKAERDQVESSLYSDSQLQISFDVRIFIIFPLNRLVTVSAFVGILFHILELPV
ncbi:hypothetical protein DPMN_082392 [Dreissena polymorpha]|uniref:Uncharacterized protein n=1 Tax=Dreissena polymorpha TaxID=45954 RepID=A0A9D3Y9Z2_DREPO|nr:hypothetical protein DPMN_082392 [Dreissena polymorpha]